MKHPRGTDFYENNLAQRELISKSNFEEIVGHLEELGFIEEVGYPERLRLSQVFLSYFQRHLSKSLNLNLGVGGAVGYALADREAELGFVPLSYDCLLKTCCVLEAMIGVR